MSFEDSDAHALALERRVSRHATVYIDAEDTRLEHSDLYMYHHQQVGQKYSRLMIMIQIMSNSEPPRLSLAPSNEIIE
jgi:hypothetical protein